MRGAVAVGLMLALAVSAGCERPGRDPGFEAVSPGTTPGSASPATPGAAPAGPGFDPPRTFDPASGTALPGEASLNKINLAGDVLPLPVALHGTTAFVAATNSLQVVDTRTGQVRARVTPTRRSVAKDVVAPFHGSNPAEAPVLWQRGEEVVALHPFVVEVPAVGTAVAGTVVELVAVDPDTAKVAWTTDVALPAGMIEAFSDLTAAPVAVSQDVLVVRVSSRSRTATIAVDLPTRRLLWERLGYVPAVVQADVVVGGVRGAGRSGVVALALRTGAQRWSALAGRYSSVAVKAGGPALVVATGDNGRKARVVAMLDPRTGAVVQQAAADYTDADCRYDGAEVLVCFLDRPWVTAFDARSGKALWTLPDQAGARQAPRVTAVWHGSVYGRTANGPVVLDARTGADTETSPGLAPFLVNEHIGVGRAGASRTGVQAYRAVS